MQPCSEATPAAAGGSATTFALLLALLAPRPAAAHDSIGVPYLAADERDPGQLVMRLEERVDSWSVSLVGRPGRPAPGQATSLRVRLRQTKGGQPYAGRLSLTLFRTTAAGGREPVHGPETVTCFRGDSHFELAHPGEDNYEVFIAFADWGGEHSLRYAYGVGRPGSPWLVLVSTLAALLGLVIVVQLVKWRRAPVRESPDPGLAHPSSAESAGP